MSHLDETISISQVRSRLLALPKALTAADGPRAVAVTKRGRPVLAVLGWDFFESLIETLEIMGDPDLRSALQASIRQIKEGKTIPWRRASKELGL